MVNLFKAVAAPVRVLLGVLDFGCEVRREMSRWEAHEDALNAAESDVDHLEPGELRHRLYCKECGGGYWTPEHRCGRDRSSEAPHLSWGVDGATEQPQCQAGHREFSSFHCTKPFGHDGEHGFAGCFWPESEAVDPDSAVSVAAAATDTPAPVETPSPSAGADPAGAPPAPAGSPNLVDLIAEVLTEHYAKPRGFNRDGTQHVRCGCYRAHLVADWRSWREHVSGLIAERIHQAAPQIDYGDLIHAAGVVKAYLALGPLEDPTERGYLRALADRLADAGRPAFTP